MRFRTLGETGLRVSEIGVDVGVLTAAKRDDEVLPLLRRALDLDITLFATAWTDGHPEEPGRGERLLGEALRPVRSGREDLVVATRFGYEPPPPVPARAPGTLVRDWSVKAALRALDRSLWRLGEPIDLLQLADPDESALESDELAAFLDDQIAAGKIQAWGVAFGPVPQGAPKPGMDPGDAGLLALDERQAGSVQVAYHLARQEPGRELIEAAARTGAAVLARAADAPGLLGTRVTLDQLTFLTRDRGQTPAQAALRFALQERAVAAALPGATPLEEAAAAADLPDLTTDDLDQIAELYEDRWRARRPDGDRPGGTRA
jgi:aryl-alcohol dehydrogenase-like predicted oxidoreductase